MYSISVYIRHAVISKLNISRNKCKSIAIPVTGHGGLWSCEMSKIPHCLDNWHTDDGEVVSLTLCSPETFSGTHSVRG
jgi:hypothetical protein